MDPFSMLASTVAICQLAGLLTYRLKEQFSGINRFDKTLREIQQEVESLRLVLRDVKDNLESVETKEGSSKQSDRFYLDEVHRLLSDTTESLRELVALVDSEQNIEILAVKMKAQNWQWKIYTSRMQLIALRPNILPEKAVASYITARSHSHLQRNQPESVVNESVCASSFKSPAGYGYNFKRECDWWLREEQQEKLPEHTVLSFNWKEPVSKEESAQVHEIAISVVSAIISAASAICMLSYDGQRNHSQYNSASSPFSSNDSIHSITLPKSNPGIVDNRLALPTIMSNPSPNDFVGATLANGLATFAYYTSRKTDRYREWFLGGGAFAAIGSGAIAGAHIQGVLLSFMPFALIASLILCTTSNYVWNSWKGNCEHNAVSVLCGLQDEKFDGWNA